MEGCGLPISCWLEVFSYLSTGEKLGCGPVCRYWHDHIVFPSITSIRIGQKQEQYILQALVTCSKLESVHVSEIPDSASGQLAVGLERCSRLQVLSVQNSTWTRRSLLHVLASIKRLEVNCLHFIDCSFPDSDLNTWADFINQSFVTELTLRKCRLGVMDVARTADMETKDEETPPRLRKLDLAYNKIAAKGIDQLEWFLRKVGKDLRELNLSSNLIGHGLERLVPVLSEMKSLEDLSIRNNDVSDGGATALVRLVPELPAIRCLDADDNWISCRGLRNIGNVCAKSTVKMLLLRGNLSTPATDDVMARLMIARRDMLVLL